MDFGKWVGVNDSPDQIKRLASAKKSACTPLSISQEDGAAIFSGSHGTYSTTLESCTCVDFSRRKLPCKHMFRLAIELGQIDAPVSSDVRDVKRPAPAGLSLQDAVAAVEALPVASQIVLMNTLRNKLYHKRDKYKQKKPDGVAELIASGLVVDASGGAVSVADRIVKNGRRLCTYLLRKFENDAAVDENGELFEYPHGAHFVAIIEVGGLASGLRCEFPDDEVTDLLDRYNANRCREWKR